MTDRPSGIDVYPRVGVAESVVTERIRDFLDRTDAATPCLAVDLSAVRHRYWELREALPAARICYAVKANPAVEVVSELVGLGASFDVASPGEIDLCLQCGATADQLSYGNTIKKPADIEYAYNRGVRLFATDSLPDLRVLAERAPGASVFCRIQVDNSGSRTPFGRKFGCSPETAAAVLRMAVELGLDPLGVSFHIGSQQVELSAWEQGISASRQVFDELAGTAAAPRMVNLGGGLPATYTDAVPPLRDYTDRIEQSLEDNFGATRPELLIEPGRALVGDAGVLRGEVVLIAPDDADRRWVYLDIGRYNGLAETEGEAITYRLRTARDGDSVGPVVLAGPTCDGDDVLYQRTAYSLPLTLSAGDRVDLLSAGAYTASYSSVYFNGFPPLPTYCFDGERWSAHR